MPFVKYRAVPAAALAGVNASAPAEAAVEPQIEALVCELEHADAGRRWRAARALAGAAGLGDILAARLAEERDTAVRAGLFAALTAIGGVAAARLLAPFLRSPDAGLRGGAIEALKQLKDAAIPVVDALLADADADTRMLAVEVTRAWPEHESAPRLAAILAGDRDVNVCAAAVDVASELGDTALLGRLAALRARFPAQDFILFAAEVARARIQAQARKAGQCAPGPELP